MGQQPVGGGHGPACPGRVADCPVLSFTENDADVEASVRDALDTLTLLRLRADRTRRNLRFSPGGVPSGDQGVSPAVARWHEGDPPAASLTLGCTRRHRRGLGRARDAWKRCRPCGD
jgi:hypothetical protein